MKSEIEELKKELKQTQLAYQMAAQMSQFKASFLARTSHELRSPLTSLIGLHQLILSDLCESSEEEREFIAQAYQSALKLMKLIDEIVAVSKTECGTNHLHLESLQLAEIFDNIYSLIHLQAANRNLGLTIFPPDTSLYIIADHSRLTQLIVNLIDSSISVIKDGKITLAAKTNSDSNWVEIEIAFQCPIQIWQKQIEPIESTVKFTKEEIKKSAQKISLSPAMQFLLSQTILETMGGQIEISDCSSESKEEEWTCLLLRCPKAEAK